MHSCGRMRTFNSMVSVPFYLSPLPLLPLPLPSPPATALSPPPTPTPPPLCSLRPFRPPGSLCPEDRDVRCSSRHFSTIPTSFSLRPSPCPVYSSAFYLLTRGRAAHDTTASLHHANNCLSERTILSVFFLNILVLRVAEGRRGGGRRESNRERRRKK